MALHLYRRHRRDCQGNHPEDSRSGEFHERHKTWKRCECLIYVSGTLAGRFNRRPTGKVTWEEARPFLTTLETAASWNSPGHGAPASPDPTSQAAPSDLSPAESAPADQFPPAAQPSRVTVAKAIEAFLSTKQATVAYPTLRKHRTFTKQLRAFADREGYIMLDQFRPEDVDIFYARRTLMRSR